MVSNTEAIAVSGAMERYGGSFVKKLGELIMLADPENRQKIRETWPKYWLEYAHAVFDGHGPNE